MHYANILTGGIGCGKSTVANLLRLEGFKVIDADKIGHQMLDIYESEIAALILENKDFNDEIKADMNFEKKRTELESFRKKIGNIIFNDEKKRTELESFVHPLIHEEILKQCDALNKAKKAYFIEMPLYFEGLLKTNESGKVKNEYPCKFVICVYANRNIQIERIKKRNNYSDEEAILRINSQIDIEEKAMRSNFIIKNDKDLKTLQRNINNFLKDFYIAFE